MRPDLRRAAPVILGRAAAVAAAFGLLAALLWLVRIPPAGVAREMVMGFAGTARQRMDVLVAWAPLLLAAAGLAVTFAAGLWNIGVEGQITMGAVFTTWALRVLQDSAVPAPVAIALAILAGVAGGAAWAALAGGLRTFGGVNEIFGGLGLNFVATALTLWLIFGPWKRPGIGSMSGTEPFAEWLWLPVLAGSRLSLWALGIGIAGLALAWFLLRATRLGLRLRAVGLNPRAAAILGVPSGQTLLAGFAVCGALAGAAGALQVTAVYHRLIPSISSGYGYLGVLVVLLVNRRPAWIAPVALFYAALNIGSIQLPIALRLDSSLAGVVQGLLVLFVLMADGVRRRRGQEVRA